MAKKRIVEKHPRELTKRQLSHFKKAQRRQRFILYGGISVIVAIVLIIMAGWFFGEYYPLNKTIVTVNDTRIKLSTYIDAMAIIAKDQVGVQQTFDLQTQADYILKALVQYELVGQAAEKLGITVSDDEIKSGLEKFGYKDGVAARALVKASVLSNKMVTGYFAEQTPDSSNQVLMNAMLVEDEAMVTEVRNRLNSGDNFTALAEKFALNTASKNSKGAFDWHPAEILKSDIGADVPVDWAFAPEVNKGDISPALTDNISSKQLGYWLIRVTERPEEGEALVQALLLKSFSEAEYIKPLLEATDNISSLADTYTQHSQSRQGHGNMGAIVDTANISAVFNGYVFNPDTKIGEWSSPVKDTQFWTKGGDWIVQVVDKEANRALTVTDQDELVSKAYSDWSNALWADTSMPVEYAISDEQKVWAIDRANQKLAETTSG